MEVVAESDSHVLCATVSADASLAFISFSSGVVVAIETASGSTVARRSLLPPPTLLLASQGDCNLLLGGAQGTLRVFTTDLEDYATCPLIGVPRTGCFAGPRSQLVAAGTTEGTVQLLDFSDEMTTKNASFNFSEPVLCVSWSLDIQLLHVTLVSESHLCDPETMQVITTLPHDIACGQAALADNGSMLDCVLSDGLNLLLQRLPPLEGPGSSVTERICASEITQILPSAEGIMATRLMSANEAVVCVQFESQSADAQDEDTGAGAILGIAVVTPGDNGKWSLKALHKMSVDADEAGSASEQCKVDLARGPAQFIAAVTARRLSLLIPEARPLISFQQHQNIGYRVKHCADLVKNALHSFQREDQPQSRTAISRTQSTSTSKKVDVEVLLDTSDLPQHRNKMDVYVMTRIVGDNGVKDEVRFIGIPARARASDVVQKLEAVTDRRLIVSFVNSSGKLTELRPSTMMLFESFSDEDKHLYCRPLYPSQSKSRATTPLGTHSTLRSRPMTRQRTPGGSVIPIRANTPSSMSQISAITADASHVGALGREQCALSRTDEQSLVQRLACDAVVSQLRNRLKLEEKFFPTAAERRIPKGKETELVKRLTSPSTKKERSLSKSRSAIEEEARRPPKKTLDAEEEAAIVHKFYYEALQQEATKCREQEKKLFNPPHGKRIASPNEWKQWQEKMARPIKQQFRLKDQFY